MRLAPAASTCQCDKINSYQNNVPSVGDRMRISSAPARGASHALARLRLIPLSPCTVQFQHMNGLRIPPDGVVDEAPESRNCPLNEEINVKSIGSDCSQKRPEFSDVSVRVQSLNPFHSV
jgi:hypothetical protein